MEILLIGLLLLLSVSDTDIKPAQQGQGVAVYQTQPKNQNQTIDIYESPTYETQNQSAERFKTQSNKMERCLSRSGSSKTSRVIVATMCFQQYLGVMGGARTGKQDRARDFFMGKQWKK